MASYNITVQETGDTFPCREDEFLLAAMKRSGTGPISYGCYGGGCGVCKMRIVSGEYEVVKRMSRAHVKEDEQAMGTVLICCVQPRADVVLAGK